MRVNLIIGKSTELYSRIALSIGTNISLIKRVDFLSKDELESLEIDLIDATKTLYDYRKKMEKENEGNND